MMEIERKWLIDKLPDFCKNYKKHEIEQFYISFKPEVRLRKSLSHRIPYRMSIKGEGTVQRVEIEETISEEFYENIKQNFSIGGVSKEFYKVPLAYTDLAYEISKVDNDWCYVEVEFKSMEEAEKFIAPDWFGEEKTHDNNFKMKNLVKAKMKQ